jgi:predicted metal-dependent peptidase
LNPKELAEAERKLLHDVTTAANIAKGRGQLPAWLDELIEELKSPSQDWAEVLRDMLADTIPNDFSFERLNRMHLDSDIVMPSNDREGLGHVGMFTDASGSVSEPEFVQFCSEWREISEELQPETMTLIQFDSQAGEPEVVERGEEPTYKRGRCGGTRFSAPFKKAEKLGILDDFDVIIVFTDGGDDTWPEEPDCPVIWATTGAFWGGPPPFGECVQVKFNR